uniref:Uncharacterized protein n=1 Tax=Marseillevirus LCMAC101 TaxID=2506602 RepID=A0A481YS96_9VIRU|nr:MAG: hypothetical protein LCMAC101_06970 [Marseillevirus LCMAC101]
MDKRIGFWLQNIPYIWVSGKTPQDCYRYYIFSSSENLTLFDSNNKSIQAQRVWRKPILPDKDPPKTYWSLFPFEGKDCKMVRNYFSVWIHVRMTGNVRMEGKPILGLYSPSPIEATLTVINPRTNYRKEINKLYNLDN